ncbi:hypothetical protein [Mesobacterium pallidum]|uniref:hypothetical protein n=1 Tax=Mesobacterium pallidum TaxID=2872037 RepID=UPI001EE19446|nr:hypothetical protein [Mesobacterium pallidum]
MRLALISALALVACTEFPELDAAVPASEVTGDYPRLLPIEQLLDGGEATLGDADVEAMQARVAALKARAAALERRRGLTPEDRARLDGGVDVPESPV